MKSYLVIFVVFLMALQFNSCKQKEKASDMNIIYLHHSTGGVIWQGNDKKASIVERAARKVSPDLANLIGRKAILPELFKEYNKKNSRDYRIKEMAFPKKTPYGWKNYPFDYYNIWVKNAGNEPYMKEPTLELLTRDYNVIIFKHCFPGSRIQPDQNPPDINSEYRSLSNYKLQYEALRDKLHEFPDTRFILFTGAVHLKSNLKEDEAKRANEFYRWVTGEWDIPGDNIHLWDLYSLQTEGDLYLKEAYALSQTNSHPNGEFAGRAVRLLFNRIIDVIEEDGTGTKLTGEKI